MFDGKTLRSELTRERATLVQRYNSNGNIRYDIATGLAYISDSGEIKQRVKMVEQFTYGGKLITDYEGKPILRKEIDFEAIKRHNQENGVESGTMQDAFHKNAYEKVVELYADDYCLRWGTINLAETPCLLKIMDDINFIPFDLAPIFCTSEDDAGDGVLYDPACHGLVHALPGKVETYALKQRGDFKCSNYKGFGEFLWNPVSLWSQKDNTHLPTSIFGTNSLIRLYGENQIIDLCGHELGINEIANIISGFSSIITLGDGFFSMTTTKKAKYFFIYNSDSQKKGCLTRTNHFAIQGNWCSYGLIEGLTIGDIETKNKAPFYAGAIFNKSGNIVICDCKIEQLSRNVTRSTLGLNWYTDLVMTELIHGVLFSVSVWEEYFKKAYQWLEWIDIEKNEDDRYHNGKKTPYPVPKSRETLKQELSEIKDVELLLTYMQSSLCAYRKSSKSADDHLIQLHMEHQRNAARCTDDWSIITGDQVCRTTNLVCANVINKKNMNFYPDSTMYGFRAGTFKVGVLNFAKEKTEECFENFYICDCEVNNMHGSFMECISIANENGMLNGLNNMGVRLFGYSNSRNPCSGVAAASMLSSSKYYASCMNVTECKHLNPPSLPYTIKDNDGYCLDTAELAFNNLRSDDRKKWVASSKLHGLYKGNDVVENTLATVTLMALLEKIYPESAYLIKALNNSSMDCGILAWRLSMLDATRSSTISQAGLRGGYKGDISDNNSGQSTDNTHLDGEIYPWCCSRETTDIVQHDVYIEKMKDKHKMKVYFKKSFHNSCIGDVLYFRDRFGNIEKTTIVDILSSTCVVVEFKYQIHKDRHTECYIYTLHNYGYSLPKTDLDKDSDYFNSHDRKTHNREQTKDGYLACKIPPPSKQLYKLICVPVDAENVARGFRLRLVDTNTEKGITYKECCDRLGFSEIAGKTIKDMESVVEYDIVVNTDGQNHIHKGILPLRFDNICGVDVDNFSVSHVESSGFAQETNIVGDFHRAYELDALQTQRPGSHVNDIHGIAINSCCDVSIDNVTLQNFASIGNIYGTAITGQSSGVNLCNITLRNAVTPSLYSGIADQDTFQLTDKCWNYATFPPQQAIGLLVTKEVLDICYKKILSFDVNTCASNLSCNILYAMNNEENIYIS